MNIKNLRDSSTTGATAMAIMYFDPTSNRPSKRTAGKTHNTPIKKALMICLVGSGSYLSVRYIKITQIIPGSTDKSNNCKKVLINLLCSLIIRKILYICYKTMYILRDRNNVKTRLIASLKEMIICAQN